MKLLDSFITQLKARVPSRTCNESKEEDEEVSSVIWRGTFEQAVWCGLSEEAGLKGKASMQDKEDDADGRNSGKFEYLLPCETGAFPS